MLSKFGTYTGDGGASQAITGIGFKPDMVVAKPSTTTDGAAFKTKDMDAGKSTYIRNDWGYETTFITSLDSDGFTVGSDSRINGSSVVYYYWAFAENADNDFKVFTFTGSGADGKALTGFGFQPCFVYIKCIQNLTGASKFNSATDSSMVFSGGGTNDRTDLIVSLDADGCTVNDGSANSANLVNAAVASFGFAFKAVSGRVVQSTYSGNGSDGKTVTALGFQPGLVWIKNSTNTRDPVWAANGTGVNSLGFDYAQVTTAIKSLDSDGFTLGTANSCNENTTVYNYLAIKEVPPTFKVGSMLTMFQ